MTKRGYTNVYKVLYEKKGKIFDCLTNEEPEKDAKAASEKEKYDFYIKQSFINGNPYMPSFKINSEEESFGFYIKRYKRIYDRYLSERLNIREKLYREIQCAYDNGKGGEFKSGKFYSVGSSSRFAASSFSENINGKLNLLKKLKIDGVKHDCEITLEKDLQIKSTSDSIISKPQMDVMINTESGDVYFIEVKCHEICDDDKHKVIKLKSKYKETEFIKKNLSNSNAITEKEKCLAVNNRFLSASDFGCNLQTSHFDFKQFLCHLMGILNYQKENKENNVNIHFYYLFYKNEEFVKQENSKLYEELEEELKEIFSVFQKNYKSIDFGYFYNNKFDTIENLKKK